MMKRLILCYSVIVSLLAGCKKDDATFNTDLAVDSRFIILNAPADTTKMVIYSDHSWTMENRDNASWITLKKSSGEGTEYAIVAVPANTSNYPRAATLLLKAAGKTDTIRLGQRGLITPTLAITAAALSAPANGGTMQTAINTTLPFSDMTVSYTYDANGAGWITNLNIAGANLNFDLAKSTAPVARVGKIYLSYLDILGTSVKDSLIVNQAKP
jgi:all-beta uncharacterized protein